jgi:ribonucleoside-diphosphate reductase alpha chain
VLNERGYPVREMGILQLPQEPSARGGPMAGTVCPECGNATVIRKDGCDFCTACGHVGSCG